MGTDGTELAEPLSTVSDEALEIAYQVLKNASQYDNPVLTIRRAHERREHKKWLESRSVRLIESIVHRYNLIAQVPVELNPKNVALLASEIPGLIEGVGYRLQGE